MRSRSLVVVTLLVAIGATACGSSSKSATTGALSGSGGGGFCGLARGEQSAFSTPNFAGTGAAQLKKLYENLGTQLQRVESIAPSAIKGDFQTFVNAYQPFLRALAAANYDFTKINYSSLTSLSSPQVKTATANIERYFTQVCHITSTTPTT
jgi:hypothetical protein